MKNPYFHKYNNTLVEKYFLDYVQLYFAIPLDDLKKINGYNLFDLNLWLMTTRAKLMSVINKMDNSGIIIDVDQKHYGLKFKFSGRFFIHNNYKADLIYLKKYTDKLFTKIIECQYDPIIYDLPKFFHTDDKSLWHYRQQKFLRELCSVEFPKFYVSRIDIAQNLTFKNYPNGLKNNNWDTYTHKTLEDNPNCIDTVFRDRKSGTTTGYAVGNPKYLLCKVYNKEYDKHEFAQEHALKRFKTYKFYRREWRISKPKIKALQLNHLEDFFDLGETKNFHFLLKSIRKSVDIVTYNDNVLYAMFHFITIDQNIWTAILHDLHHLSKRMANDITGTSSRKKPVIQRKYVYWDGVDNIVGIARGYRHRWTEKQWKKCVSSLLESPETINFKEDSNIDMEKVRSFLSHING